jgi:hypothetical protein
LPSTKLTIYPYQSKLESFVGDPNFPEKITSKLTSRGERIKFYEGLYKKYSRLAFTRWEDRPIAIAGLERRLIRNLRTRGGWGIFDDGQSLLRRSLLWQRGEDEIALRKITFPPERNITVPSWSWMAYEGGIDFLDVPLGEVEWDEDKLHSPWRQNPSDVYHITNNTANVELKATAKRFDIQSCPKDEFKLVYDIPRTEGQQLLCIVMGRFLKAKMADDARHYVLFIALKSGTAQVYERVGVGFMPGKFIQSSGPSVLVSVR